MLEPFGLLGLGYAGTCTFTPYPIFRNYGIFRAYRQGDVNERDEEGMGARDDDDGVPIYERMLALQ